MFRPNSSGRRGRRRSTSRNGSRRRRGQRWTAKSTSDPAASSASSCVHPKDRNSRTSAATSKSSKTRSSFGRLLSPLAIARRASDPTRSPLRRSSRSSRREAGQNIPLSRCIETKKAARDTRIWASTRDGEKRLISSLPTQRKCKQGKSRRGSPERAGRRWHEFFVHGPPVSEDFMSERDQPPAQERGRTAGTV